MFGSIFSDNVLINYINENLSDPWTGTPFEGYVFLSPKQKGEFGEKFISKYFYTIKNSNVQKPINSGHDRIVDNKKTEFKFSLATRNGKNGVKKDQFIINHISKDKDWERLVFFGINFDENDSRMLWFTKDDFLNYLEYEHCIFNHQQGGKSIKNDDYICTKVDKLLKLSFIKSIDQW
jgi:hypothetical protein